MYIDSVMDPEVISSEKAIRRGRAAKLAAAYAGAGALGGLGLGGLAGALIDRRNRLRGFLIGGLLGGAASGALSGYLGSRTAWKDADEAAIRRDYINMYYKPKVEEEWLRNRIKKLEEESKRMNEGAWSGLIPPSQSN